MYNNTVIKHLYHCNKMCLPRKEGFGGQFPSNNLNNISPFSLSSSPFLSPLLGFSLLSVHFASANKQSLSKVIPFEAHTGILIRVQSRWQSSFEDVSLAT